MSFRFQTALPLLASLLLAATSAQAQYRWKDENGRTVFGDRPPPGAVDVRGGPAPQPMPRAAVRPAEETASPRADEAAPGTPSVRERLRERQAERTEAEAREKEKRQVAERQARGCEAGRASLRLLETGGRIATVDDKGERRFLEDDERLKQAAQLRADLARDCAGR